MSERDVRVLKTIGTGASSVVQKGYLAKAHRMVAIKKINAFEKEKRRQLMNDIKALCAVQHPAIVQFLGAYQVGAAEQAHQEDDGSEGRPAGTHEGPLPPN